MRLIIKASGEKEQFNIKKFKQSLSRTGVPEKLIRELAKKVEHKKELKTTNDIYEYVLNYLSLKKSPVAARYNLKNALLQLGPSGFPFERFLSKIFERQGYEVLIGQIISGNCVTHEIDLVLNKKDKHYFVESKFHNRQGIKSDIKVALYMQARFKDIENYYLKDPGHRKKIHKVWVVTNTKFTSNAIKYAECVGMNLLDWSYPPGGSLSVIIDKLVIHPITALTSLSAKQKKSLIERGVVLCSEVRSKTDVLKNIGFTKKQIDHVTKESENICSFVRAN